MRSNLRHSCFIHVLEKVVKTPTLEEIQGLRKFLDELTTPKRDLTVLNQAIEDALCAKNYAYATGLALGSHLSPLGLNSTEYTEVYLRIRELINAETEEALKNSDCSPVYRELLGISLC